MKILYKLLSLSCLSVAFSTCALRNTTYVFINNSHDYTVHLSNASCQQYRSTTKKCTSSLTIEPRQASYIFLGPKETDPPIIWKMQLKDKQNHTLCDNAAVRVSFYKDRNRHGGYSYRSIMRYTKFCKGLSGITTYKCNRIFQSNYYYYKSEMNIHYMP